MKPGAFTFVLHSHIPYCRGAGRWPHGEEWLHEAVSGTYIPLLDALYALRREGCPFKLTISITPVLLEQLDDSMVLGNIGAFVEDRAQRAEQDEKRFAARGESGLAFLASQHGERYEGVLRSLEAYQWNLVGAFKRLQDEGFVEIAGSAATHGYLPLLSRDSSIYGQIKMGVETYRRHFGRAPRAFWLPECGYRAGLETFLAEQGLSLFFSETHAVEGGEPVVPYEHHCQIAVSPGTVLVDTQRSTYQPYRVGSSPVAVIGRNSRTGMQVWSAQWGYPGDPYYREFHKKDGTSGLQYWRVTGSHLDLGQKDYYMPEKATERVNEHIAHFSSLAEESLAEYHQGTGRSGIIVAAYDTELFGHWWFEGVEWIKGVLRRLSQSDVVELTTASEFIASHPIDPGEPGLRLPESSWGQKGDHSTWRNRETEWMWLIIHSAEEMMERLADKYPDATGALRDVLNQGARELLLLESSDWPFLITTGQAKEYAVRRFNEHADRFEKMAGIAQKGTPDERDKELCQRLYGQDKLFQDIDYRFFQSRRKSL
ncbi:MAG: DUF1957 domain-containing protein [Chloroflexi bacterium]|nr:DUF1957 domain-containing protein [Chloroflexota bacterium]